MKHFKSVIGFLLGSMGWWGQLQAAPVFLGPIARNSLDVQRPRSLIYMTAEQMAVKVRSLTGFYQPGFEDFSRIIGTFDPKVGNRTNDRPTALTVLILEGLLSEVASNVVAREIFLDENDRMVFKDIELDRMPEAEELKDLTRRLCLQSLFKSCPAGMEEDLAAEFMAIAHLDLTKAWTAYLGLFLQNGALYYL